MLVIVCYICLIYLATHFFPAPFNDCLTQYTLLTLFSPTILLSRYTLFILIFPNGSPNVLSIYPLSPQSNSPILFLISSLSLQSSFSSPRPLSHFSIPIIFIPFLFTCVCYSMLYGGIMNKKCVVTRNRKRKKGNPL